MEVQTQYTGKKRGKMDVGKLLYSSFIGLISFVFPMLFIVCIIFFNSIKPYGGSFLIGGLFQLPLLPVVLVQLKLNKWEMKKAVWIIGLITVVLDTIAMCAYIALK